ncbi:hypothetical protein Pelo_10076 [Pelomyxa schiedti]|nr:hypothetical protein Pelo_10076 [Pelomyxa schiedti]
MGEFFVRDGKPIRVVMASHNRTEFDLTKQVLSLEIPVDKSYGEEGEAPLMSKPGTFGAFTTAGVIANKAKQFDDGLYAAVELLAQNGTSSTPGKRWFLSRLHEALVAKGQGSPVVVAAADLGGNAVVSDSALLAQAQSIKSEFLGNALRSKPIAFYTWNPTLTGIFQQDRMMQTELEPPDAMPIKNTIAGDPMLAQFYKAYLTLISKLTNPLAKPSLLDNNQLTYCIFPPSIAPETELAKKMFSGSPIPPGFQLMNELISRVQGRRLSLAPSPNSGWYDYCLWAIECLLRPEEQPEAAKLNMSREYKQELVSLFKALMALTRETHIKQLEIPLLGCCMPRNVVVSPKLTVEPLVTFYSRRSESYKIVKQILLERFTEADLQSARRLRANGESQMSLLQEIDFMINLFAGLSQVAANEIGLIGHSTSSASASPSPHRNANICDKGHTLVPCTMETLRAENPAYVKYRCDRCNKEKTNEPVMHCRACQYDICPLCTEKCPTGHPLLHVPKVSRSTIRPGHADGFKCNCCGHQKTDDWNFHCHICDYDLCLDCTRPVTTASSASSGIPSSSIEVARTWLASISSDTDLQVDNRMMVPVFFDLARRKIKVWCVLGYATKTLKISFSTPPRPLSSGVNCEWKSTNETYTYPVFAEVYCSRILNRDEFRALCDIQRTFSRIVHAVEAL